MTLLDFWPTPEALAACAAPDAGFVAVHRPSRLTDPTGQPADERAVLAALLAPGGAVVPVVGAAGAGKSHLLRWLALHLPTSLRVVTSPDALPDPPAAPAPDEAAATELLLEAFRAALRQRTAEARAACDAAAKAGDRPPADERAVAETHGDGLVALLAGPTKDALFRGTPKRPSVFRALVRRVTTGADEPGAERFEPADFEFPDVNSARLADPRAQRYVAKLKTNLQGERATAAALLNAARDAALARLPAPDAAVADEPGCVLLADDADPALAAALAARGGRGRAVVALRGGYDGPAFVLGAADAAELVGARLNAARLGAERLEAWFEATGRDPDAAAPVFDADLSADDRAVLEAHGASAGGHFLFPLTPEVLAELAGDRPTAGRLVGEVLPAALVSGREAFAPAPPAPEPVAVEPAPVPEPVPVEPTPEPEPVAVEPEPTAPAPDPLLAALAVVLGRLPAPAPVEVARFLAAAHTTGADLELLTPGVVEWLRAHGQTAFRVRAG